MPIDAGMPCDKILLIILKLGTIVNLTPRSLATSFATSTS